MTAQSGNAPKTPEGFFEFLKTRPKALKTIGDLIDNVQSKREALDVFTKIFETYDAKDEGGKDPVVYEKALVNKIPFMASSGKIIDIRKKEIENQAKVYAKPFAILDRAANALRGVSELAKAMQKSKPAPAATQKEASPEHEAVPDKIAKLPKEWREMWEQLLNDWNKMREAAYVPKPDFSLPEYLSDGVTVLRDYLFAHQGQMATLEAIFEKMRIAARQINAFKKAASKLLPRESQGIQSLLDYLLTFWEAPHLQRSVPEKEETHTIDGVDYKITKEVNILADGKVWLQDEVKELKGLKVSGSPKEAKTMLLQACLDLARSSGFSDEQGKKLAKLLVEYWSRKKPKYRYFENLSVK